MLVLNLPFKALMFLTLMRPSLVLFLVLWLKLVKDFLKVRCRLALLPFLISCLIWLDLVASLPLIKEMQLDNQKEIAEMQNETQKEIAGIQSATSRQNTKEQVYAQNEMLAYQQKESNARVASIMENTNLSKQQQVSEIMRQMLTQAQTAGQYFTNDQIKEMTRKVSAEVDLVHQQTQNQRYGSSHIGATAKDISNVVTDAASGVVDIFHGIDKAVADTWNNFWKDGKADGIGSNLSRK